MVDVHAHILPKMDDGSSSVEETMELLHRLAKQGVETVVATPHFYPQKDNPKAFLERRAASVSMLPALDEGLPKILLGAEVGYFEGMSRSEELWQLQLGQTGLFLIEMPFRSWTDRMIHEILQIQFGLGLQPVLAHVNRYRRRSQLGKYGRFLLEKGVYFQCNAEAFNDVGCRSWALKACQEGKIHFLGSDCHNCTTRPPMLDAARNAILKKLGKAPLEEIAYMENTYFK